MKKYYYTLISSPLFSHIPEKKLDELLRSIKAKVKVFSKDEAIFLEGSPAIYIGIVLSGTVLIVRTDYYGNRSIVSRAEPGELFGEALAFSQIEELPVSVVADSKTEVLMINCDSLINANEADCEVKNQIIRNLLKVVAVKNLSLNRKIEIISKRTTREKLLTFLMYYAKKCDKNEFDIPYDRQQLADFLEVERSAMSAEIGKMRKEGIIKSKKKHFVLLKPSG